MKYRDQREFSLKQLAKGFSGPADPIGPNIIYQKLINWYLYKVFGFVSPSPFRGVFDWDFNGLFLVYRF